MIRTSWRLSGLAAVSVLYSSHAQAAPGDATHLEYARSARAAGCPDREALRSAVSRRLGYDPFFPVARQTIVVEISDADDGLLARMQLLDEQGMIVGSRELRDQPEHCDELVASLALAVSIALDPSAAFGTSAEPPAPKAEAEPPVVAAASPAAEAAVAPAVLTAPMADRAPRKPVISKAGKARANVFGLRSSAFVGFGTGPDDAWGFRIGANFARGWFRLAAELVEQLPTSRTENTWFGSVKASLTAGDLAPCVVWNAFAGCALLEVGDLRAQGQDVERATKLSALYAALGGRLEYAPTLYGDLHLLLNADLVRPLTPIALQLRGQSVWATPAVAAIAAAGLEVRFQ